MELSLIDNLVSLGLAKAEALVYIDIIENPNANGSQITKRINIPKPSVYLALEKLYQRGLINLIPGESKQYIAVRPEEALNQMRENFNQNISKTIDALNELKPREITDEFIHIKGFSNFINKVSQMLKSAKREIYIQTNANLNLFAPLLHDLNKNKVRIIVHSFGTKFDYQFELEEYFDVYKTTATDIFRMILVTDYTECLMSSGIPNNEYLAIYTRQQLQVSIISETIHNDIYWLKLYQQKGQVIFDCHLDSLAEKHAEK